MKQETCKQSWLCIVGCPIHTLNLHMTPLLSSQTAHSIHTHKPGRCKLKPTTLSTKMQGHGQPQCSSKINHHNVPATQFPFLETPLCSDMPQNGQPLCSTYIHSLTRPSTGRSTAVTVIVTVRARATTNWHMLPPGLWGSSTKTAAAAASCRQQAPRLTHSGTDSTPQARARASAICCLLPPARSAAIWSTTASESMAMLDRASATLFSSLHEQHTQEEGVCLSKL